MWWLEILKGSRFESHAPLLDFTKNSRILKSAIKNQFSSSWTILTMRLAVLPLWKTCGE